MSKKLFIGGLPYSVTEQELKDMFAKVGNVLSCSLITDKFTNQSKGFGFIEMDDADADKAINALNGQDVGGRNIAVSVAKPREERGDSRGGSRGNFDRGPRRDSGRNRY